MAAGATAHRLACTALQQAHAGTAGVIESDETRVRAALRAAGDVGAAAALLAAEDAWRRATTAEEAAARRSKVPLEAAARRVTEESASKRAAARLAVERACASAAASVDRDQATARQALEGAAWDGAQRARAATVEASERLARTAIAEREAAARADYLAERRASRETATAVAARRGAERRQAEHGHRVGAAAVEEEEADARHALRRLALAASWRVHRAAAESDERGGRDAIARDEGAAAVAAGATAHRLACTVLQQAHAGMAGVIESDEAVGSRDDCLPGTPRQSIGAAYSTHESRPSGFPYAPADASSMNLVAEVRTPRTHRAAVSRRNVPLTPRPVTDVRDSSSKPMAQRGDLAYASRLRMNNYTSPIGCGLASGLVDSGSESDVMYVQLCEDF